MADSIDTSLLERIDALELSENNLRWKAALKQADWQIYADRERWTVESWKATEGEDLQIRRAKLLANVLDHIEIRIHDFDEIVGRPTPGVIGCATAIDVSGDYIPDIWSDAGSIEATLDATASIDRESLEILRESVRTFRGSTFPEAVRRAWEEVFGSWISDVTEAKLKDPSIDAGITAQSTSVLSWNKILRVGLRGYIEEAQQHIDAFLSSGSTDVDKLYFWRSAIIVLEAAIRHANRYASLAEEMAASEQNAAQKAKLLKIAVVCRRVPEYPAESFHEALQSMQFCNLAKMLENPEQNNAHWGRADQYLYRFFRKDYEAGVPLEEMASQLADLIGRWGTQTMVSNGTQKQSHQINFGINNVMLCGMNKYGEDCSNELSYLFLHLVGKLKLSSPTVGIRWNRKLPDWLMRKAIRTNMETRGGIPLFENDEVVISSYVRDGIPFDEAVEWCGLGCVYPTLPTRAEHYGAEGVATVNLAGIFQLALRNGRDICGRLTGLETGDPRDFRSFEELYQAFLTQHRHLTYGVMRSGSIALQVQSRYYRTPLQSVLGLEASMALGQDVMVAHPDYALFGISDRAIIDVADSMTAIRKLVFEEKKLTMAELLDALESNFDGEQGEVIRQMCLRQPKYGNDDPEADALVARISHDSGNLIRSYDNAPYRNYMVAREGLAWHYFGGLGVGALPNGRRALEPLNDGAMSPQRGADTNGPTAVLNSACSACYNDVCYAAVLNQKFSASILSNPENIDKLAAYTNAYMESGGSHIQFNIADTAELKAAKAEPEKHEDLIVRIGGFSAYFVQLSPEIQDDVVFRSEHQL